MVSKRAGMLLKPNTVIILGWLLDGGAIERSTVGDTKEH